MSSMNMYSFLIWQCTFHWVLWTCLRSVWPGTRVTTHIFGNPKVTVRGSGGLTRSNGPAPLWRSPAQSGTDNLKLLAHIFTSFPWTFHGNVMPIKASRKTTIRKSCYLTNLSYKLRNFPLDPFQNLKLPTWQTVKPGSPYRINSKIRIFCLTNSRNRNFFISDQS